MNTQSTRREVSDLHHGGLRADRRFRLNPDAVAKIPVAVTNEAHGAATSSRKPWRAGLLALIERAVATLQLWRERAYSRRELATFDRRMLRDIGVSPYDAGRESSKPFWRD